MVKHDLTDEELTELYNITKFLKSEDEESKELGIGLLKNYPSNAKYRILDLGWKFSDTLDNIINKYRLLGNYIPQDPFYSEFRIKGTDTIIDFVVNILFEQCYYIDE